MIDHRRDCPGVDDREAGDWRRNWQIECDQRFGDNFRDMHFDLGDSTELDEASRSRTVRTSRVAYEGVVDRH